jgi:hypothetical protein
LYEPRADEAPPGTPVTARARLRPGSLVEVCSPREILATLDERGQCCGLPFMPEMLAHVGKRYRVAQVALKMCAPAGNVTLHPGFVYLDDLRCDGAAHGDCQAECRFFWRAEWLRPVRDDAPPLTVVPDQASLAELAEVAAANVRAIDGEDRWRCHATNFLDVGTPCSWKEPRQYAREVRSRNVTLRHLVRVVAGAAGRVAGRRLGLVERLTFAGSDRVEGDTLDLQPGELVEIRSAEEIGRTLDERGRHRGLTFTDEMAQHCGEQFRVRRRVERIIDEGSGRMLHFKKTACITLEGLVCSGDRATRVWFCRKDLYPFWREAWLRRVDAQ